MQIKPLLVETIALGASTLALLIMAVIALIVLAIFQFLAILDHREVSRQTCCIASIGWSFDARKAGYTAAAVPRTIENSEDVRVKIGS